jgi:RimJ/RimL family protein N-acetyltransferase
LAGSDLADLAGSTIDLPRELRTERLLLRTWRGADADELRPVLLANQEHLKPWIPESSYGAPPVPQLAERLEQFASRFDEGIAFRYALRDLGTARVLGGMSLFPRNDRARVALAEADRVEIGYWLDKAVTGQGYVTEAVTALLDVAPMLPNVGSVEIRCHVDNAPSAGVPRRLGFELTGVQGEMQVWRKELARGDSSSCSNPAFPTPSVTRRPPSRG